MILKKIYHLLKSNRNQWMSRYAIQQLQLNLLKKIITHAYSTVPYYRNLFQNAGISPQDITTLDDIKKIPLTRKKDLLELNINERLSSTCRPECLSSHRTGGSTGKPLEIFYENSLENLRAASLYRMYLTNGFRPTDKIANLAFHPVPSKLIHKFGVIKRVNVPFAMSLRGQIELLITERPQVLEGYPSRLSILAKEILKNNIKEIKPRLIFTNSETLTLQMKNDIANAFEVQPINVYESWEFGTIAWECHMHEGLHIEADRLIVEILPNGNKDYGDEPDEIIVTDLYNKAMPFIRYAIGDVGIQAGSSCSCGRTFPLIKEIIGRESDEIFLPDGTGIMATTQLCGILEEYDGILEYQWIQNCIGELELLIIADNKFNHNKEARLKSEVINLLKLEKVEIRRVQKIDKTMEGKRIPFISNVNKT